MAEMTPRQIGAFHAALDLQDIARRKAAAARAGLTTADSEAGKGYLTGKAEWWDHREEGATKALEQMGARK